MVVTSEQRAKGLKVVPDAVDISRTRPFEETP